MANYINNGNLAPELLESDFKAIISPVINFKATLLSGTNANVAVVGDDGLVYITFTLDTLNTPIASGLVTNLAPRLKFVVTSGESSGRFKIELGASI
jgi:hypothetical protein